PNRVKVGKAGPVRPDEAFLAAEQAAQTLKNQIENRSPTLPEAPKLTLLDDFRALMQKDVAPSPRLARGLGPGQSMAGAGPMDRPVEPGTSGGSEQMKIAIP